MKKRIRNILKVLLCGVLAIVPLFPMPVSADTYITTSNIMACAVYDMYYQSSTAHNLITCVLDNNYYGSARMTFSYRLGSQTTTTTSQVAVVVNGNTFNTDIATDSQTINRNYLIHVDSISSNNITLVEEPEEIIERLYNYPLESYNAILPLLRADREIIRDTNYGNYTFPVFMMYPNQVLGMQEFSNAYSQNDQIWYFVFYSSINPSQYFSWSGLGATTRKLYSYGNGTGEGIYQMALIKFSTDKVAGTRTIYANASAPSTGFEFFPIYSQVITSSTKNYASLDFSLNFNLPNPFIDYIYGTYESSVSSDNLEDSSDDITTSSNQMFTFENTQNTNMNNALQNINTNYDISSFGSSFLSSANWVRQQFDNLTNNTPFGSVLSFSLLLGLALLIIGKVYK